MLVAAERIIWKLITHYLDHVQPAVFRPYKTRITNLRVHGCLFHLLFCETLSWVTLEGEATKGTEA